MKHWFVPFLSGLAGVVVGMCLVALIVAAIPQAGAASTGPNGEPAVHMGRDTFIQNVVLVPKGSKLLLVADSVEHHILDYGRWDANGMSHSLVETGAPPLHEMVMTGGSMEIGPFTTAGVYHIYCTIHRGIINQAFVLAAIS